MPPLSKVEKSKYVNVIMTVLDELVEDYHLSKVNLIKKTDNFRNGYGGKGQRKVTLNWVVQMEKPTREEILQRVKGAVDLLGGDDLS